MGRSSLAGLEGNKVRLYEEIIGEGPTEAGREEYGEFRKGGGGGLAGDPTQGAVLARG